MDASLRSDLVQYLDEETLFKLLYRKGKIVDKLEKGHIVDAVLREINKDKI